MDNFGTEIGQKMRSAVKAKLLELGTGGSSGYIDDELPDYVMIMVANKRSKQQMIADLNLFLGSQTDLFVTWLHEVLQKLQEVTLPAAAGAAASAKKRKSGQKEDSTTANKKDKRSAKKEKSNKSVTRKTSADGGDNPSAATSATAADGDNRPSTTTGAIPVINSITDVFAEQLLEKAKKTMDVASESAANIKKGKGKKATAEEQEARDEAEETNEFDIPTISEISSTTDGASALTAAVSSGNREKDLAELANIQKKIYAAKRHLKQLGEINEDAAGGGGESEDEDFLNLKDDDSADEFNEAGDLVKKPHNTLPAAVKAKSPIVFDARDDLDKEKEQSIATAPDEDQDDNIAYLSSTKRKRLTPPPIASVALITANEAGERCSDRKQAESDSTAHVPVASSSSSRRSRERERREPPNQAAARKRPVHERLGMKPPSQREAPQQRDPPPRERRVRQEKELYVPAFRRKEQESGGGGRSEREAEGEQRRERDNERKSRSSRERERERGDRDRSRRRPTTPEQPTSSSSSLSAPASTVTAVERRGGVAQQDDRKSHHNPFNSGSGSRRSNSPLKQQQHQKRSSNATIASPPSPPAQRQRIGSRVIVAPAKPAIESSDDEDLNDKPVNSVIKIKPRPPVSPSKQACKNLLLRAVAEAQRSTIAAKSRHTSVAVASSAAAKEPKKQMSARLGAAVVVENVSDERNPKLYTKSYRERLKCSAASSVCSTLFRRTTQNLVIEVESGSKRSALRKRKSLNEEKEVEQHDPVDYEEEEDEEEEEEYVPAPVGRSSLGDEDYQVQVQQESGDEHSADMDGENFVNAENDDEDTEEGDEMADKIARVKTQFVVTLNDDKSPPSKYKPRSGAGNSKKRSRSVSPLPQVTSSSSTFNSRHNGGGSGGAEPSSTTHTRTSSGSGGGSGARRKHDIKSRLSAKASSSLSPSTHTTHVSERESSNSSPSSNTPPPPRRSELIEIYRKPKDIKKIIIKNDSEDDEMSPKKASPPELNQRKSKRRSGTDAEERSTTPPLPPSDSGNPSKKRSVATGSEENHKAAHSSPKRSSPSLNLKRKRMPIKFDLDQGAKGRARSTDDPSPAKRRSKSGERERERDSSLERGGGGHGEERRKITIRAGEAHKYENIPSLSSVAFDSGVIKVNKPKERCKYHPNCTKQFCEFYHPTAPCKSFPNCKFADKCMYSHPHCKFDMACGNLDCNYSHSGQRNLSLLQPTAPPLSSHVVPVQNYKSISVAPAASSAMCKYFPNCTKGGCTFYHPKQCRFGNNCINKLECSFYHHEIQSSSKFKWVASLV